MGQEHFVPHEITTLKVKIETHRQDATLINTASQEFMREGAQQNRNTAQQNLNNFKYLAEVSLR